MASLTILPWQQAQLDRIRAARGAGRLGHALLLSGPEGVGKRRFAEALAASLMCEAPTGKGLACGRCRSCVLFTANSHPDWMPLQPEEDKRDISIDAVRELGERLALSAQLRRAKVACLDPVDSLNINGINALLKTIEEPPPEAYLLLLSSRPQALPATLRSRCQRLPFPVPAAGEAAQWLAQKHADVDAAQRDLALRLAFGAPLAASAIIESGGVERDGSWRAALAELANGKIDPLQAASRIGKDETRAFMRWLLAELTGSLRSRLGAASPQTDLLRTGAAPVAGLEWLLQNTMESLRNLDRNANPLLSIESLMIGWQRLFRPASV
jgi:DNA polymerase-3 subunit delta'